MSSAVPSGGDTKAPGVYTTLDDLTKLEYRARGFSFRARQPVHSLLSGRHSSRVRGRGLDFEEVRDYRPGDDVRSIDWKVTARTGQAHTRVFNEERDRPALLVVDQRLAMFYGTRVNVKSVTAAETAALAALARLPLRRPRGGGRLRRRGASEAAALARLERAARSGRADDLLAATYRWLDRRADPDSAARLDVVARSGGDPALPPLADAVVTCVLQGLPEPVPVESGERFVRGLVEAARRSVKRPPSPDALGPLNPRGSGPRGPGLGR